MQEKELAPDKQGLRIKVRKVIVNCYLCSFSFAKMCIPSPDAASFRGFGSWFYMLS